MGKDHNQGKIVTVRNTKEDALLATIQNTGRSIFSIADAADLLNTPRGAASDMVLRLFQKRKLQRIEKAKYLLLPPGAWQTGEYSEHGLVLASHLIQPCYVSFWSAINYYGWTEQISRTVFVATPRQKKQVVFQGITVRFIRLHRDKFFGFESQQVGDQSVFMADPEKVIVDCLDQPRYCGDLAEAAKAIWNGHKVIDIAKLLGYMKRMKNGAIAKRLGYLTELLGIIEPGFLRKLQQSLTAGYSKLDPLGPDQGNYDARWRMRVNVRAEGLTDWMHS